MGVRYKSRTEGKMPPSGFSQEAINGLLKFVKAAYESVLTNYKSKNLSERETLKESICYIEGIVKSSVPLAINGTISIEGIEGLAKFVSTNYLDLIDEIIQGKKKESEAVQNELEHINDYLAQFKL